MRQRFTLVFQKALIRELSFVMRAVNWTGTFCVGEKMLIQTTIRVVVLHIVFHMPSLELETSSTKRTQMNSNFRFLLKC